jgi:hypothetical protein
LAIHLVTEWQYRTFCIELSKDGYRKSEKDGIVRDSSQVFLKVFNTLRAEGLTRGAIARELSVTLEELDSLLVGLVIASVANTQTDNQPTSQDAPTREPFKLKAV